MEKREFVKEIPKGLVTKLWKWETAFGIGLNFWWKLNVPQLEVGCNRPGHGRILDTCRSEFPCFWHILASKPAFWTTPCVKYGQTGRRLAPEVPKSFVMDLDQSFVEGSYKFQQLWGPFDTGVNFRSSTQPKSSKERSFWTHGGVMDIT